MRLEDAASDYLRNHDSDLVDWWPWCDEAFAEARKQNLPIFVSVGYASCHWCHVMARESFNDQLTAQLLNQNFVSIKVDREERPDVDAAMTRAAQAITGQGGWPTSIFLTPQAKPFFAGTYFPATPSPTGPSFNQVITVLAQAWQDRRDEVVDSAAQIASHLAEINQLELSEERPNGPELVAKVLSEFDKTYAGFGGAPKFPNAPALDALLVRSDPVANDVALISLEYMLRGGIFDQIGGGFHRYAVDDAWQVPHFEKMLYDNALLIATLARGFCRARVDDPEEQRVHFERAIRRTIGWLKREMRVDGGGFAASQDADSLDENQNLTEGAYYLWSPALLDEALGANSLYAQGVFHVTPKGNLPNGSDFPTDGSGLSTLQFDGNPDPGRINRVLDRLVENRAQRPHPARDNKTVAAWNGYLIDSLVYASMVLDEREWLELAEQAGHYLWSVHWSGEQLARVCLDGVSGHSAGGLEDYAAVALGFSRLAGATGDASWLEKATILVETAEKLFGAADGGFYDFVADENLDQRLRQSSDNATPSPSSVMIAALRQLAQLSGREQYNKRADQVAKTLWASLEAAPRFAGWALMDLLHQEEAADGRGPAQIVIVAEGEERFGQLVRAAWRVAPSGSVIVAANESTSGFGGLFDGRKRINNKASAYICHANRCEAPISDWTMLREPLWGSGAS